MLRAYFFAIVVVVCAGCAANHVNRGVDLYAGGQYVEAAEVFERTEVRLEGAGATDRARYGLYRGATLLALGDVRRAQRWLSYTQELLRSDSAILSSEDRTMLDEAVLALSAIETPAALPVEGPAVAASQTAPIENAIVPRAPR